MINLSRRRSPTLPLRVPSFAYRLAVSLLLGMLLTPIFILLVALFLTASFFIVLISLAIMAPFFLLGFILLARMPHAFLEFDSGRSIRKVPLTVLGKTFGQTNTASINGDQIRIVRYPRWAHAYYLVLDADNGDLYKIAASGSKSYMDSFASELSQQTGIPLTQGGTLSFRDLFKLH